MGELLTGVDCEVTCSHNDPLGLEGEHAHVWRVTAWWAAEPLRDGRTLRAGLQAILGALPDPLPPALWSGEAIAQFVMVLSGCVGVDVDRDGFHVWP